MIKDSLKLFYSGPLCNAELLLVMLEKHGIHAVQRFADGNEDGNTDDLDRDTFIYVSQTDYDLAHSLFLAPPDEDADQEM
ncbi:MAG: hypothetical protein SGI71_10340 [Verrucomicrobiota bacterium]|nr:hypothetical protein [Verrucomicrobiota bacterium]